MRPKFDVTAINVKEDMVLSFRRPSTDISVHIHYVGSGQKISSGEYTPFLFALYFFTF